MSNSSPLTPSKILGSLAKLLRTTEDQGVEWLHWLRPVNDSTARENLSDFLKRGCPVVIDSAFLPKGAESASLILGNDFISPEKSEKAFGFTYDAEQMLHFNSSLPSIEKLIWLRRNDYFLMAGPVSDLSVLDTFSLDKGYFAVRSGGCGWYSREEHRFSRTDKVRGGEWLMLRKEAVPRSTGLSWYGQTDLVCPPERIPNAAEVCYGIVAYHKVNGRYLISDHLVRTSSVDQGREHVSVGFGKDGLHIYDDGNYVESYSLGVASARD